MMDNSGHFIHNFDGDESLPRSSAVVTYLEKVFFATSRLDAGIFQVSVFFFSSGKRLHNNGKIRHF